MESARRLGDPRIRSREFGLKIEAWILRDVEAALAYVRSLPSGNEFTQGVMMVVRFIGRTDFDRALSLANELAVTPELRPLYSALFSDYAARDLAGAVQRISRAPTGPARESALRAVVDFWGKTDSAAALAWAQGRTDTAERRVAVESALVSVAAAEPLRAVELARSTLDGASLERTLDRAIQVLLPGNPGAAAMVVELLPGGETQTLAAASVARALAKSPEEAVSWVNGLPAGTLRETARRAMLESWATADPNGAASYAASLPAEVQQASVSQVARAWAALSPGSATAWVQGLPSGSVRDAALSSVASGWAEKDAPSAARWAATLGEGSAAATALKGAMTYWLLHDPRGAQEFAGQIGGAMQAAAAAAIAPGLAQRDPVGALNWALSLPEVSARESAATAAYNRWRDNAPADAAAWLARASLPPALKNRLGGMAR